MPNQRVTKWKYADGTWRLVMQRVAIVARVSTDKQEYENQLLQLREFCTQQKWTVVHEFCDVVTGSGKKERKQFAAMMLGASQKRFDVVLFWSLDRFSREGTLPTLQYLQLLDSYGVAWRSFTEPYIDSCGVFRDVVISLLATMAKQERIQISDRTKAGLARARKQGRIGGRPKVDVDMAEVLQRRDQGESFAAIADDLGCSQALLYKRLSEANA
jgi:DNA invertase Pin-like site-specific DNA recombinase